MAGFCDVDVRRTLAVAEPLAEAERADPFPLETLNALADLVGADAVGYCESPSLDGFGGYELCTRRPPQWLYDTLPAVAREDPTHPVFCAGVRRPVAVSDFLTAAQLRRRQIYDAILEPLGIADSLRLYLPAPDGTTRFFFFDRSRRGFSPRSRRLLELLRPTLERACESWSAPRWGESAALSARELEVLRWVAAGLTNAEVGRRLWLSPHTVRTHLEHAYRKLGVRTRTEAVARLRQGRGQGGRSDDTFPIQLP